MRPGLRMPRGSSAAFTRRVIAASAGGSSGTTRTALRNVAGAAIRVQVPPDARAADSTAWWVAVSARPASHTNPPPQSRKPRVIPEPATIASTAGPAEGRTDTRHTAAAEFGPQPFGPVSHRVGNVLDAHQRDGAAHRRQ